MIMDSNEDDEAKKTEAVLRSTSDIPQLRAKTC